MHQRFCWQFFIQANKAGHGYPDVIIDRLIVHTANRFEEVDMRFLKSQGILALKKFHIPIITEGTDKNSKALAAVNTTYLYFNLCPIKFTNRSFTIPLSDKCFADLQLSYSDVFPYNSITDAMACP